VITSILLRRLSALTGITIPPNTFGYGVYIPHWGSIVVNGTARFGNNCVIQSGVNISENVVGGDHVYIGAGAKILSDVHIADDVIIGANAVVTKDISTPNVVVAGIPARIISNNGFKNRIKI
jgi:serine O-acetyltransferase